MCDLGLSDDQKRVVIQWGSKFLADWSKSGKRSAEDDLGIRDRDAALSSGGVQKRRYRFSPVGGRE